MTTSVFLVYKTDTHHSYKSRDILGIATSQSAALRIIIEQVNKEDETLEEEQLYNLNNILQTQGYSGDGEFQIEEVTTNTLL